MVSLKLKLMAWLSRCWICYSFCTDWLFVLLYAVGPVWGRGAEMCDGSTLSYVYPFLSASVGERRKGVNALFNFCVSPSAVGQKKRRKKRSNRWWKVLLDEGRVRQGEGEWGSLCILSGWRILRFDGVYLDVFSFRECTPPPINRSPPFCVFCICCVKFHE